MPFHSILFDKGAVPAQPPPQPDCFPDLNLDQVIEAVVARREEYDLKPFFHSPLRDVELLRYRHAVMKDLEDAALRGCITAFAGRMVRMRRYLRIAEKSDYQYHSQGWTLEAALAYCGAVQDLVRDLERANPASRGFTAFRDYMLRYSKSAAFQALWADAQRVQAGLLGLRYAVVIQIGRFTVLKYEGETDYSVQVEKTFERFKQGAVKSYLTDLPQRGGMNHIEAQILEFVSRLHPDQFAALNEFCTAHGAFVDQTLRLFDREVQFYLAWLEFMEGIRHKGLSFCYPKVHADSRQESVTDGFDVALAQSLLNSNAPVICNDYQLSGPERVMVVSGPNQGGKTTFARMFGQLHYLASLGLPVPGSKARLFLCDRIFTHFEKQEDIHDLRGKLEDDLLRIHDILDHVTPASIVILNEAFASTTLQDAVFLSQEVMKRVNDLDLLGVWVTFIDELASFSDRTVSMVSTVVPENPAERTFRILRRPADGLAYALSLAEKHRLTYRQLKERIRA